MDNLSLMAQFNSRDYGITIFVHEHNPHRFGVSCRDECGEWFPTVEFFRTPESAMEYARLCAGIEAPIAV